ncbi:MAG: hypothetical protein OEY52_11440 [Gammaproteobacteria bacterium]|nr:hypothetical protein [Gammaproteobacteria bacterium]
MSLVVKPHNPWRMRIMIVFGITINVMAGWILYEYGRFSSGFDSVSAYKERAEMMGIQDELEDQIESLREQKAVLEREAQIEKKAYTELDINLKALQLESQELKEELAFYRGIVSPANASAGLRLQRFKIESTGQPRNYRSKVVLTQVLKNHRLARGYVRLSMEGLLNGQLMTLNLKDITEKRIKEIQYRFKYFQNLEEDLVLPEGFQPLRAMIKVIPTSGKAHKTIEKTIELAKLGG